MVNFGGHSKAVREGLNKGGAVGDGFYLVHYNDLKALFLLQDNAITSDEFAIKWKEALAEASADLEKSLTSLWEMVFSDLPTEQTRGAPPSQALQLYVQRANVTASQELRRRLTRIHTAAVTNYESLRKLVKKFDKQLTTGTNPGEESKVLLSQRLLPILYSSNIFSCQSVLEGCIAMVRTLLDTDSEEEIDEAQEQVTKIVEEHFKPLTRKDSEAGHAQQIESRMVEHEWLKRLIASIPESALCRLVAHRGFHNIKDRNDKRPLENSLAAYETAWTSGIHLCECDVALTKDEKLVLAHDDDFHRLALDSKSAISSRHVSDLTFKELMSLPLKSGIRPPLLIDVLRSAYAISDQAKLIVEIKPGNVAAAAALARLLWRHPELCRCVEMIMSFDAFTMHRMRMEIAALQQQAVVIKESLQAGMWGYQNSASTATTASTTSTTSTEGSQPYSPLNVESPESFDHFGTTEEIRSTTVPTRPPLTSSNGSLRHRRPLSMSHLDSSSVGLSLSHNNLQQLNMINDVQAQHNASMLGPSEEKQSPRIFPKLMLLTVAQPPHRPCELNVGVEDLSPIDSWLVTKDGALDGVYLQFQKEMMTPKGAAALSELSQRYAVGVWGYSGKDPDTWETFDWLVTQGNVRYVNTDLPNNFRKKKWRNIVPQPPQQQQSQQPLSSLSSS